MKCWTKEQWKATATGAQTDAVPRSRKKDENAERWNFIEDENSVPVSPARLQEIFRGDRSYFNQMLLEVQGKLCKSWEHHVQAIYREGMVTFLEEKYREFFFCEDHWKALQAAIFLFTAWPKSRRDDIAALNIKTETSEDDPVPSKRPAETEVAEAPPAKRANNAKGKEPERRNKTFKHASAL